MEYPSAINQVLNDLTMFPDREGMIEYLLETGSRFQEVPPTIAVRPFPKTHQVPACESEAYVWYEKDPRQQTFKFYFAVENPQGVSARALAVILDEALSGKTASEILLVDDSLITKIFGDSISMGKGEGLRGMLRLVRHYAANAS